MIRDCRSRAGSLKVPAGQGHSQGTRTVARGGRHEGMPTGAARHDEGRAGLQPGIRVQAGAYPARVPYSGRYRFRKHYYELIDDLKATGEEFQCAQIIDPLPEVKHWVRNPASQPRFGFWLGTARALLPGFCM